VIETEGKAESLLEEIHRWFQTPVAILKQVTLFLARFLLFVTWWYC